VDLIATLAPSSDIEHCVTGIDADDRLAPTGKLDGDGARPTSEIDHSQAPSSAASWM
jgi:hypothetical protein